MLPNGAIMGTDSPGPFAEMLRRRRLASGLSQRELARRSGLSERAVRDLERGATARPRHHSMRALADALGIAGDDLTGFASAWRGAGEADSASRPAAMAVPSDGDVVGRDDQLLRLADLVTVGRHRIVTITGPAGVGKSRLAAEVVTAVRRSTDLDVRTIDLSALDAPELVGEVVAEVFAGSPASRLPPTERIAAELQNRRAILVLDCFERLVAAAPFVAELARRCAGLTVLTTSQRPLGVSGERRFPLDPLPEPAALDLLVRRATAVAPDFRLTDDNTDAVRAVCRRVGGLPLALELAAAKMRVLTAAELLARLDRQLRVLTGGPLDLPPRHRSLRAAIESTLELLSGDARTLFDWLGVFSGGGRLADIEAVAATLGYDADWVLAALTELVDTSLARPAVQAGASRFTLPDTMAELAAETLDDGSDAAAVRTAVATRFWHLLLRWAVDPTGPAATITGTDAANLRSAVAWLLQAAPESVDRTAIDALHHYYEVTGRYVEGQETLARAGQPLAAVRAGQLAVLRGDLDGADRLGDAALSRLDPADHVDRAHARLLLGTVASDRREMGQARRNLRAALVEARRAKDLHLTGRVLNNLGVVSATQGRLTAADRLFVAALQAKQRSGAGPAELGRTLNNLAQLAFESGRYEAAVERATSASERLCAAGRGRTAVLTESMAALALLRLNRAEEAGAAMRRATRLLGDPGEDQRTATVLELRSSVLLHSTGDRAGALVQLRAALPTAVDFDHRTREEAAFTLYAHAALLTAEHPAVSATLLGAADELLRLTKRSGPETLTTAVDTARRCRDALGAGGFDAEYARGVRLDSLTLLERLGQDQQLPGQ
jgi:predicted ATPase/transcriptional regulator with XRE-family HTH domain